MVGSGSDHRPAAVRTVGSNRASPPAIRAHGTDRLSFEAGRPVLTCRQRKPGWEGRQAGRLTHADFPGTAVAWDGTLLELIEAHDLPHGAVRYVFVPWDDANVLRRFEAYDETSELQRANERRRQEQRNRTAGALTVLLPLTGMLPGDVQLDIDSRYGLPAARSTAINCLTLMALGGALIFAAAGRAIAQEPTGIFVAAGSLLFFPALVRLRWSMASGRPCGLLLLEIPWAVKVSLARRRKKIALAVHPSVVSTNLPLNAALSESDRDHLREGL